MDIQITLKNYRCFDDSHPARFSLHKGFTSYIGINNSGKSNILKFFYEFKRLFADNSSPQGHQLNALRNQDNNISFPREVYDRSQLFNNSNERDIVITLEWDTQSYLPRADGLPYASKVEITIHRSNHLWSMEVWSGKNRCETKTSDDAGWNTTILGVNDRHVMDCKPMFDAFGVLGKVLYIGPFRNAINIGTKEDYYDIQIGQSFIQTWQSYQSGTNARNSQMIYKLTADIKRIFEYRDLQIMPSSDNQTLQFFVNGKSYKLSELGSGIVQFVLVLANASIRQPSYILIDEPELNLHPSLQIDFLTTLSSYAQFGTLFATHSIGLARATSEYIYSVRRDEHDIRDVTRLENVPSLSEFLGELSFAGYRDLGYNKILLVEGSTEVKTFHQFLRKYQKDHKIIVLPLGGSDLIKLDAESELTEILRITSEVYAVVDSEKDSQTAVLSKERTSFKVLCDKLGINCIILERRATENYLSDRAIKNIKGEKFSALGPFESLKQRAQLAWAKSENWRIAGEMTKEEIEGTDLGNFLLRI